jgi:hypothetical protein
MIAAFLGALGSCLAGAQAQTGVAPDPSERVVTTAFEYDDYLAAAPKTRAPAAIQDKAAAAEPAPATATVVDATACPCPADCCAPKPWSIPQPCFLQANGIKMGGWLQQGITGNASNPADRFNGPVATNDRSGDYQLNQFWVYFDRPTNTDGCGFDIGGRIDMCYGTDWRYGKNFGLEDRINGADQLYGFVLPQFYLEVAYNDLTIKAGHYGTGFGYEAVPAVLNFFYSHSYAMCYSEPILVTGVQATYKLDEHWSVESGFNRGWMMFEEFQDNSTFDYLGGLHWADCDKITQISFMTSVGREDTAGLHNRVAYSLVMKHKLDELWDYVIQHNLGVEENANLRTGNNAQWYGINQALFYKINPAWQAGLRFEWFQDAGGSRVAGIGNWIGSNTAGWAGGPGFSGDFFELTAGLNWRPHPNVTLRPEVRYDWYEGSRDLQGNLPFNDGLGVDQFTFATDLIVTF